MSVCPQIGYINFNHLLRWCLLDFSTVTFLPAPFEINE